MIGLDRVFAQLTRAALAGWALALGGVVALKACGALDVSWCWALSPLWALLGGWAIGYSVALALEERR